MIKEAAIMFQMNIHVRIIKCFRERANYFLSYILHFNGKSMQNMFSLVTD